MLTGELNKHIIDVPEDREATLKVINWIKEYGAFAFEKDNLKGHLTGSMIIINPEKTKMLLMLHKKFQRWQHFGGHCDGEINVRSVAIREFHEESGVLEEPEISSGIFHVGVHDVPLDAKGRPPHFHFDLMYLGVLSENVVLSHQESEVDGIGWFTFDDAQKMNNEPLLSLLLEKIRNLP